MTTPARPIRLLIVDDSRLMRTAIRAIVADTPAIEVIGEARDGATAVEMTRALRPDVITMDIEMPGMDGLEATRAIMIEQPTPIIVLSSHSSLGAATSIKALGLGAVDFLEKSDGMARMDIRGIDRELCAKLLHWGRQDWGRQTLGAPEPRPMTACRPEAPEAIPPTEASPAPQAGEAVDLVVIAVSTGGPKTLPCLLQAMGPLRCPVVVAQHMPDYFTASYAEHLRDALGLDVVEGADGMILAPNRIVILVGGIDSTVERIAAGGFRLRHRTTSTATIHPSADVLFESAAQAARAPVAVILTGMGADGSVGARRFFERRLPVLAQTPATAVVWGMPSAAIDAGVVSHILPVEGIGRQLALWAGGTIGRKPREPE